MPRPSPVRALPDITPRAVGLGPSGSNAGEVSGSTTTPTFVENLVSEGTIDEPVFGIYVGPLSDDAESAGEITFGGVDESRISGACYTSWASVGY